jgi:hypothetical protein
MPALTISSGKSDAFHETGLCRKSGHCIRTPSVMEGGSPGLLEVWPPVPTLTRYVTICAVTAGLIYTGLWSLATFVQPAHRVITISIPVEEGQR